MKCGIFMFHIFPVISVFFCIFCALPNRGGNDHRACIHTYLHTHQAQHCLAPPPRCWRTPEWFSPQPTCSLTTPSPGTTRSKKVSLPPLSGSFSPSLSPSFPFLCLPRGWSTAVSPRRLTPPSHPAVSPRSVSVSAAYSHVIENTAFFGDVALRFPRIVHHYYDRNAGWGPCCAGGCASAT